MPIVPLTRARLPKETVKAEEEGGHRAISGKLVENPENPITSDRYLLAIGAADRQSGLTI